MKQETRWGLTFAFIGLTAIWTGCVAEPKDEDDDGGSSGNVPASCQSDADCKGDRICEEGQCVAPDSGSGGMGAGTTTSTGSGAGGSGSEDASLKVVNTSEQTVFWFYARYCGQSGWSGDLLGDEVIPSGYEITFNGIEPNCYDFRAETQEGGYWEFEDIYLDAGEMQQLTLLP